MDHAGGNGLAPQRTGKFVSEPMSPDEAMRRAKRLCWWQLAWFVSVVAVMGAVMGQSQTMKTAWIEDMLGFAPPPAG